MPIYEYSCENCSRDFELLIRGQEKPVCPHCDSERLIKALSVPAAAYGPRGAARLFPVAGGQLRDAGLPGRDVPVSGVRVPKG